VPEPPKKSSRVIDGQGWVTVLKKGMKASKSFFASSEPVAVVQTAKLDAGQWPKLPVASSNGQSQKKSTDVGRKIFVAGVKFDDITAVALKENWNELKLNTIKAERATHVKSLFAQLGAIERWDDENFINGGYAFVTYKKKEEAEYAMSTMSSFDNRKAFCKRIRARVIAQKGEKISLPSHSFYVRWPRFVQKINERKATMNATATATVETQSSVAAGGDDCNE